MEPLEPWGRDWRERAWERLAGPWDVLIIGGGIVGAGLLREAARAGWRALLVEANDFASGTSSRSGKMVHGGLRYLKHGELGLTLESIRERERLLREAPGLVDPSHFLVACLRGDRPAPWVFHTGFFLYDLLAGRWEHRRYRPDAFAALCPAAASEDLRAGFRFLESVTDDARLVLRLVREGVRAGGTALSYARVVQLLRDAAGQVCGATLRGEAPDDRERTREVLARVVINATGGWADELRAMAGRPKRLRLLRGGHLVLPAARLPLPSAVFFVHPGDHRPMYALPWEGTVLVGTTDRDHHAAASTDPELHRDEVDYLLTAVRRAFPSADLRDADVQACFAGFRAVEDSGQADPSRESRDTVLLQEDGLLTVTGGKLTTFRTMARAALRRVRGQLGSRGPAGKVPERAVDELPEDPRLAGLDPPLARRWRGRYGADAGALVELARPGELDPIGTLPLRWVELRWAAREEGVVRLEDLLLRRVRLGLLAPRGGMELISRIQEIAQPELGWDRGRWETEVRRYAALWQTRYAPTAAR